MKHLLTLFIAFFSLVSYGQKAPICEVVSIGPVDELDGITFYQKDDPVYYFNMMYTVLWLQPSDTVKLSRAWLQNETNIMNTYFRLLNTDIVQVPQPFRSLATDVKIQVRMIGVRYVRSGNTAFPDFLSFFDPTKGGINAYNPQNTVNYYYAPYTWSTGVAVLPNSTVVGSWFHGAVTQLQAALNAQSNHYTAWVNIHELGHYWNLLHTFQDGCAETNCTTGGDRVCDTPPHTSTGCSSLASGCPDGHLHNGHNHMSYSDRITCAKMFTAGQSTRMRTAIVAYYGNHTTSTPGNQPPTCRITLPSKDTTVVPNAPVTVNTIATDDKRVNVVELHYQFVSNDGLSDNQVEFTLENENTEVVVDSVNYGSLFFRFTQPPYRLTFNAMTAGTIAIHAQASDDDGAITETAAVRISVRAQTNDSPVVLPIIHKANGSLEFNSLDGRRKIIE